MTAPGPQLRPSVILKTESQMDGAATAAAFGCSRAVLYFWRQRYEFPRGVRVGNTLITPTAEISAWAHKYGVRTIWI